MRGLDKGMSVRSAEHWGMFVGHDEEDIGKLVCRHSVYSFVDFLEGISPTFFASAFQLVNLPTILT